MGIFSKKKPTDEGKPAMTSYTPMPEYQPLPQQPQKESIIDGIQRATEGFSDAIYSPHQMVQQQPMQPQMQPQPVVMQQPKPVQQPQPVVNNETVEIIQALQELDERIAIIEAKLFRRGI